MPDFLTGSYNVRKSPWRLRQEVRAMFTRFSTLSRTAKRVTPIIAMIAFLFQPSQAQDSAVAPECPHCKNSASVVRIAYGRPSWELQEEAKQGKVHLGGCSAKKERWYCNRCKMSF
jgi:hypothetical protein